MDRSSGRGCLDGSRLHVGITPGRFELATAAALAAPMFRAVNAAAKAIAETRNAKFAYFIEPSLSPDVAGVDPCSAPKQKVHATYILRKRSSTHRHPMKSARRGNSVFLKGRPSSEIFVATPPNQKVGGLPVSRLNPSIVGPS